jgi:hypothetical protein
MAPRKSQKDTPQGPSRGALRKRARRDSSLVGSQVDASRPSASGSGQERASEDVSESTSQQPIKSWAPLVDSFESEPMSAQIQRYKDWRRTYMQYVQYNPR